MRTHPVKRGSGRSDGRGRMRVLVVLGLAAALLLPGLTVAEEMIFRGEVRALPDGGLVGVWQVAAKKVNVTESTAIDQSQGEVARGVIVEVSGVRGAGRSIDATSVVVIAARQRPAHPLRFSGVVEALPEGGLVGSWTVSGRTVVVDAKTEIDQEQGDVAVGMLVDVHARPQPDGSVLAFVIKVRAVATPAEHVFCVIPLIRTEVAPVPAEGVAVTRSFLFPDGTVREDVKLMAARLAPFTAYQVLIDEVDAASFMTNPQGHGHAFASSAAIPGAQPLPAELQPLAEREQVVVVDESGEAMLTGAFASARCSDGTRSVEYLAVAVLRTGDGRVVGHATARAQAGVEVVEVRVQRLAADTLVGIFLDGAEAAALTTDARGRLGVLLSSAPGSGELLLSEDLRPVAGLVDVELRDADGTVLAAGALRAAVTMTPSSTTAQPARRRLGK